jgi:hypothetical protein
MLAVVGHQWILVSMHGAVPRSHTCEDLPFSHKAGEFCRRSSSKGAVFVFRALPVQQVPGSSMPCARSAQTHPCIYIPVK